MKRILTLLVVCSLGLFNIGCTGGGSGAAPVAAPTDKASNDNYKAMMEKSQEAQKAAAGVSGEAPSN